VGDSLEVLSGPAIAGMRGRVQLVLTSPPFPLNHKKRYGNLVGQKYLEWLTQMAPLLRDCLTADGSIVLELGNAWEKGSPTMSTLPMKSLLAFLEAGRLHLCQEFVCYNPARLPGPAQWVTVERIRVKDAFTRVWWMSPSERPKASNRNVLTRYSESMQRLLEKGTYNPGRRPSGHVIGKESFLGDKGGAIPPNVLIPAQDTRDWDASTELLPIANTASADLYQRLCRERGVHPHPARMQEQFARFFIELLTDPGDLVLDPFAGSNTTGAMAETLGRRWISVELNEAFVEASQMRFRYSTSSDASSSSSAEA